MSGIFISYRRDDSAGFAGRLFDALRAAFPGNTVFIDIDGIDAGRDFVEALNERLASCEVLLAIIGRQWLETDPDGRRRIDAPDDYVRLEIETALKRNIRVIPILVGGAKMPEKEALPESLEPLVRRNAMDPSHARFSADAQRLVEILRPLLAARGQRAASGVDRKLIVGGALAVLLPIVLLLAVWAVRSRPPAATPTMVKDAPVTETKRAEDSALPAPAPRATDEKPSSRPTAPPTPPEPPIEPKRVETPAAPAPSSRPDPLRVVGRFDPDSGKARIEVELGPNKTVKRHAWCERLTVYSEFGNFSLIDWHRDGSGETCRVRTDWKNHRTGAILANDSSPWPRALNESLQALCPKTFAQKLQGCEAY